MQHNLHPKIKELKLRAAPVTYSNLAVSVDGTLDNERELKGYLTIWNEKDTYGTVFMKGCCAKSIRERGPEAKSTNKIAFLWQHDSRDPIGQLVELKEDDTGLYFRAILDEVPNADRALRQVRSGTINNLSIGFDFNWEKMEYDEKRDALLLKEIELYEGSVVTIGSVPGTKFIRSIEQLDAETEDLHYDTDEFIKSIPRKQQLELRQLISRHISLAKIQPDELRHKPLEEGKPDEAGIDYQYLITNFKLS